MLATFERLPSTTMCRNTIIPSSVWTGQQAAGLVGQQLALAEHDQLAVDALDRLDDVDVLADDRGDVGIPGQRVGRAQLERARLGDVLVAPVEVDDHHLGSALAGQRGRRGSTAATWARLTDHGCGSGIPLVISV